MVIDCVDNHIRCQVPDAGKLRDFHENARLIQLELPFLDAADMKAPTAFSDMDERES